MLFLALLHDKPGHLQVRMDNRPAHLDWLKAESARIKIAGPYLNDEAAEPRGSLLIVEAEDLAGAKALLAEDPYAKAGLFQGMEVHPWRWVVGAPAA